jgi:hypothetical protein
VSVIVKDDSGNEVRAGASYFLEEFAGERYLHLQATMSRNASHETGFEANFSIAGSE